LPGGWDESLPKAATEEEPAGGPKAVRAGDRIRIVKLWGACNYKVGDEVTVTRVNENTGGAFFIDRNGEAHYAAAREFEVLPREKRPELRVGARIRAIEDGAMYTAGDTGTVLRIDDDDTHKVFWDHNKHHTFAHVSRFEVIG